MSDMDKPFQRAPRSLHIPAEELKDVVEAQPGRRRLEADQGPIAAPPPRRRVIDDSGFNRIPEDVRDRRDQVGGAGELFCARPISEQMIGPTVPPIRPARMIAVELLESLGEPLLVGAKNDVMVVRHETPRVDLPLELLRDAEELAAKRFAVVVVPHDEAAVAAAAAHVIDPFGIDGSMVAPHAQIVADEVSREGHAFLRSSDTRAGLRLPCAVGSRAKWSRRSSSAPVRAWASRTRMLRASSITGATTRTSTLPASSITAPSGSSTATSAASSSCARTTSSTSHPLGSTTSSRSTSVSRGSDERA